LTCAWKNKKIVGLIFEFMFGEILWLTVYQLANGQRSHVRTAIKNVLKAIEAGDKTAAEVAYKTAVPAIDRSVAKGIMPKNKAARHKSRLNSHVRAM